MQLNPSTITRYGFTGVALLAITAGAHAAPTYQYDVTNPGQNSNAAEIESVKTTYDVGNEQLSWQHEIADTGGQSSDGFWVVLSDGPNPKYDRNQYTILYGDSPNSRLTAYEYSGENNGGS